ncbi:PhnB protein [Clostridium botulinum]|uniref:PhnB protein n=3 Tax=Clostridium TaxID=1485 RepID=A0A846JH74_CLOBO|nr:MULTISPECIES: hypothetical protein [Clostridium]EKX79660.1 PhnB protein [Clostridium botulinum CFSAN001628]ACA47031.1 PhnB protein [Clostridium botulinum B1 str. Okra]ACA57452.1 PhnB protein [Clostridium botulinum A3 str. Loch Maree]APF25267.1 putative phnB protein [Clostridium sporogenes]APH17329.1 putative phnB protein [Clostridium sporogenes]
MKEVLKFYKGKLELKERRIVEYVEEKNSCEGFKSSKREIEYSVLKAEIEMLKRFIDDLEDIK